MIVEVTALGGLLLSQNESGDRIASVIIWLSHESSLPDISFEKVVVGMDGWDGIAKNLSTEELKPIAQAFSDNFSRALTPAALIVNTIHIASLMAVARKEAEEHINSLDLKSKDKESAIHEEMNRRIKEQIVCAAGPSYVASYNWAQDVAKGDQYTKLPQIHKGLELTLAAMLINAWTAFETLAGDLWTEAVDRSPDKLGIRAINNTKSGEENEGAEHSKQNKSETLRFIEKLIKDGDTIEAGKLIRRQGKFDFANFDSLKSAYRSAFADSDKGKKRATIGSLLASPSFLHLNVLDAVRNALVHNSGEVDHRFRSRANKSSDTFAEFGLDCLNVGDSIKLDGIFVNQLLRSTLNASTELLKFVDNWFVEN